MNNIKKVSSFTVFSNDFKNKLTTAYPFLTADQIQLRLRKKWNDLSPNGKNYYQKAVLCPIVNDAPVKKQDKPKREKKISPKVPKVPKVPKDPKVEKAKKIPLEELTIFDDDFEYVSEEYEEGCFGDIFNRNKDERFYLNSGKSSKTYLKSRYNVVHPVPMVIDETPFGQQGILKKSSSEKERKMKVQFNFTTEHKNGNGGKKKRGENCDLSTLHKETKETKRRLKPKEDTKALKKDDIDSKHKNSKPKKKGRNSKSYQDSLESDEEIGNNRSLYNEVKLKSLNLGPSENIEPLTPELQMNISPKIIEKMCQAPKKKAIKGNFISTDKMDCSEKENEAPLSIGNLDKMALKRKPLSQKERLIEEKSPSNLDFEDEEFPTISMIGATRRNKSLSYVDVTKSNQWPNTQDFYAGPPSPSLDDQLDLSNASENMDTSIGWELSDEVSPSPVKHSTSLEKTLQLMKNSSSFTSLASCSSESPVSDCSSLSGFSQLSDQEMDVYVNSADEVESDENVPCEEECKTIEGITSSGDWQNEIPKKNEESNSENENTLCDMFDDKHSTLTRLLPPPGNSGEKIATDLFEEASIFG